MPLKQPFDYNWRAIMQGWWNNWMSELQLLSPELEKIAAERMRSCSACPLLENDSCSNERSGYHERTGAITRGCGCPVKKKIFAFSEGCPLEKWPAIQL